MPDTTPRLFRAAAMLEAVSWAGLLVSMFFKHVMVHNELGVRIFGPIHGGFFLLYALSVLLVRERLRWDTRTTLLGLLAAVPPFATVVFARWEGRRASRAVDAADPAAAEELAA